ncbi:hypothetical protein [Sorangium sp. So ce388]|uniref:hypothetical protein n=1 Tax=Sorangium sp. So ce388 TaxID=3133309 RepID=UPI003F5B2A37
MSKIEDIKKWLGMLPADLDVMRPVVVHPKPDFTVEEAVEAHREAVAARKAAKAEATAAEFAHAEKSYALKDAVEVERRAAELLVEASARGAGVAQDVPPQRVHLIYPTIHADPTASADAVRDALVSALHSAGVPPADAS